MAKYGIIESVNMASTNYAARIFDVQISDETENGTFGYLDGLVDGETHVYKFVKGVAPEGKEVVVIDQPVWSADPCVNRKQRESDFIVKPENGYVRVRVVDKLDEMGFNAMNFASAARTGLAVGQKFTVDSNGKLAKSDEPTGDEPIVVELMRTRNGYPNVIATGMTLQGNDTIYEVMVTSVSGLAK